MESQTPMTARNPAQPIALGQNRVLRNTYMLLALSMVPTIAGAWIGVATGFNLFRLGHPAIGFIVFIAAAMGFIWAIEKNKNSAAGIPILLGFTFFMGLVLSGMLTYILSYKNGAQLIGLAFGGTAAIFAGMAAWASTIKKDLSGMGKVLFIGVIMLIVASFANIFLQLPGLMIAISVIAIGIFSAYLLYDLNRIMVGGETNYITATLAVYIDLFQIFQNLLMLLGIFGGDRD
ncbi:Bax inhibitor-1/YccA family protein [Usitatibacter palustris]|uniref:Modulator of FtsH protease YccA n=1 Tax=Usitatibacter palustris TaxID=2732487 RepID=A0A6M4H451_9PROT|nr:Bax inhibitor-1/YccA family protein [Usitatibacter palustris]QJR14296.1 Modulator of FtsH protease YccA [Usitatibacter palustris]